MKLTRAHAKFWMENKGPKALRSAGLKPYIPVDVNSLIPSCEETTSTQRGRECTLHNTIAILKGVRKRKGIEAMLIKMSEMSVSPACSYPKVRAKHCAKWLKRVNGPSPLDELIEQEEYLSISG
jgi:hypothetical protein